jgi:hypothetical protein
VKRFTLSGGDTFIVFKFRKISLDFFDSFLGNAKKNEVIRDITRLKLIEKYSPNWDDLYESLS